MPKAILTVALLLIFVTTGFSQKPKSGTYTYTIAFAEWQGQSLGATCTVIIKGDSITVINNGSITGKKGDIIDAGIIMKHKTGAWVIGHSKDDKQAAEIGGCTGGPTVVEFRTKKVWLC